MNQQHDPYSGTGRRSYGPARTTATAGPARTAATAGPFYGTAGPVPYYTPTPATSEPGSRLGRVISKTLHATVEREQQRRTMLAVLVCAQIILALAIAPGYVGGTSLVPLVALGAAVVINLATFVLSRSTRNSTTAAYLLVFGGVLPYTVLAFTAAFDGNAIGVMQAGLLFLAAIVEAGLFFSPDIVLIAATTTTTLISAAILLAVASGSRISGPETYLISVYSLGLHALVGLLAWLVAHYIYDSTLEAQRARELQFAQARLDSLQAQIAEQQNQQAASVDAMRLTLTRVMGGEHSARVDVPDGDLGPLAETLNLMLDQVARSIEAEQVRARMEAASLQIVDMLGRMTDANTMTPSSLPIMTNTPFDAMSLALSNMHSSISRRLTRVQQLSSEVAGAVEHSRDGLRTASEEVNSARQLSGMLIAAAEAVATASQRQQEAVEEARRMLATLLPPEITRATVGSEAQSEVPSLDAAEAAALRGLGADIGVGEPGWTQEFAALHPPAAPRTVPLPAIEREVSGTKAPDASSAGTPSPLAGELPAELVEVWHQLRTFAKELTAEQRALSAVTRDMGLLSRSVRQVDAKIAWTLQALDAVRRDAEQLQQSAGTHQPPPDPTEMGMGTQARPTTPSVQLRAPQLSRPLSAEGPNGEPATLAELADDLPNPGRPVEPGQLRLADLLAPDVLDPSNQGEA